MKNILVLGGTSFVGRVFCERLEASEKYNVTLFNRGKTNPGLFRGFSKIKGDRESDDILKITAQDWDCVIDISGYFPVSLEKLLHALRGKVKRYIYISTVSVYQVNQFENKVFTEDSPTTTCSEEEKISTDMQTYSQRKSESERIILEQDWLDTIILRPSLIFGKYDPTDRLYYWLYRAKMRNKILVPEQGKRFLSYTFVDDLAEVMLRAIEVEKHREVYNLNTINRSSFREIIGYTASRFGTDPELVSISLPDYLRNDLQQWTDLPLYLANIDHLSDNSRSIEDFAVEYRSMHDALDETFKYYKAMGWPAPTAGISLEKEDVLIEKIENQEFQP